MQGAGRAATEGLASPQVSNYKAEGALDGYGDLDHLISIENVVGTDRIQSGSTTWSDLISGSTTINVLDGRWGNDALLGQEGDDTLIGGTGFDWLTGGAGADLFQFDAAALIAGEFDVIWDFVPGLDRIEISAPVASVAIVQDVGQVGIYCAAGSGFFGIAVVGGAPLARLPQE